MRVNLVLAVNIEIFGKEQINERRLKWKVETENEEEEEVDLIDDQQSVFLKKREN